MNQLRFISRVVYRLKRRYGSIVDFYYRTSSTVNLETGQKTVVKDFFRVNRAIVLPSDIHREFRYDLTFIATNKNFTYGGHFDTSQRRIIVDRKDVPLGRELEVGQYCIYDGRRYELKQVEEFEERTSYFIVVKEDISHARTAILDESPETSLGLDSTVSQSLAVNESVASTVDLQNQVEEEIL